MTGRTTGGTSTPRPFELPDFPMPYATRVNPHLGPARRHARAWAREMGMLDPLVERAGYGVWTESSFDAADFALFAALTHPDTPAPELDLAVGWHVCWWYFDDLFVDLFKRRRDPVGARAFVARLRAFMPVDSVVTPVPTNPVERGLADLWRRTAPGMSPEFRRRFADGAMTFAGAALWELANLVQNRMPDPVDYIEMRRLTGGTDHSTNLAQYALGATVPPEVFASRPMRTLLDTFADVGPLRNDIFSYRKEIEDEGENSNGVRVVQRFLGCDLQQAVHVVNDLATARLRQFEYTVTEELPPLFDELGLGPEARAGVHRFVRALQDWMAGDLAWSRRTGRYRDGGERRGARVPSAVRAPRGPAGLGTSAARIGAGGPAGTPRGARHGASSATQGGRPGQGQHGAGRCGQ